jgi:hypothetical protein
MMAAANRMAWTFDRNIQESFKGPRALEHIAYYLDHIDQHLERIADILTKDGPHEVSGPQVSR